MNYTPVENERTIRIRDLFITICQRWRSLIVCLIIGAVVLGAYGWWKSGSETIITPEQADAIAADLNQGRKEVIESYAEDILDSTEQIIRQGKYNKDAQIMKLDPFHLYVYELKYYLFADTDDEGNRIESPVLGQAYISALQEDFLREKLNAVIEDESESENKDFYASPTIIKIDKKDLDAGILTILLYYPKQGQDEEVSLLKNAMQTAGNKVLNTLGDHSVKLIGESGYECADMDIGYIQEANLQRINDLTDRIDKIKKTVTDSTEKTYLDYLLSHSDEANKAEQKTVEKASRHISKKYILAGAILGLILAAVVIIIKYIASNSIKNAQEIEDFGVQMLGSFSGGNSFNQKRKTKLDQWLRSKKNHNKNRLSDEEMADLIATKIKIEAEKSNLHSVCLAVDRKVNGNKAFLDRLTGRLGEEPSVKVVCNILERSEELEGMSGMDGVVLVEQMEQSGYDDLKKICALCHNYQVNVIGCIAID